MPSSDLTPLLGGIRVLLGAFGGTLCQLFHFLERGCDLPDSQSLLVTDGADFIDQHFHSRGPFRNSGYGGGNLFEIGATLARFGDDS